jgi:CubicO group peptidase (beta-lactamase class C family)
MLLNRGALHGRRILSRAAVEVMTQNHTGDIPGGFVPRMGYGLTFSVREPAMDMRVSHVRLVGSRQGYDRVILLQRTNSDGDVSDEINAFMALASAAIED